MSNFFQTAERYPPVLVRILARKKGRAMTSGEIANATFDHGTRLSHFEVEAISKQINWNGVSFDAVKSFLLACNLDFTSRADINRIETYLRKNGHKPSFRYLTSDPNWKTYYLPLLVQWRKSMTVIPKTLPLAIQKLLAKIPV